MDFSIPLEYLDFNEAVLRFYRNARLGTIGEGTSEMQKTVLANELIKNFLKRFLNLRRTKCYTA